MKVTDKECLEAVKTIIDYFNYGWAFTDCGCYYINGDIISMDIGYFFDGLQSIAKYLINKTEAQTNDG